MPNASIARLQADAQAIWRAGVDAVTPASLFANKVRWRGKKLEIDELSIDFQSLRRLIIVGAGKASAGMATEFEQQLLPKIKRDWPKLVIDGWINCPEQSFAKQLDKIHLHAARPIGSNSPTEQAVYGTRRILELVGRCDQSDLVLCLISGGGSALLVSPPAGLSLGDKQLVASTISAAGGNIEQLNTVRRALSLVKGGGLARACTAGKIVSLILSDVLGDSLATIASGPTLLDVRNDPHAALCVLEELHLNADPRLANVVKYLSGECNKPRREWANTVGSVEHVILANNADAVDAAGIKAVELGYRYVMQAARSPEPDVLEVAQRASEATRQLTAQVEIDCWISGGEPTVRLPESGTGLGGRNQQLTLAVLRQFVEHGWPEREIIFLSGGTDGEDGPCDAAGAWFDREIFARSQVLGLEPLDYLLRADAYHFFDRAGGLMRTGPTGTNVCDLRVALCARPPAH
jgi:glycerate 2-kinase